MADPFWVGILSTLALATALATALVTALVTALATALVTALAAAVAASEAVAAAEAEAEAEAEAAEAEAEAAEAEAALGWWHCEAARSSSAAPTVTVIRTTSDRLGSPLVASNWPQNSSWPLNGL
jgi:septal ring factor EnvC (AmiA/AmiB activator)